MTKFQKNLCFFTNLEGKFVKLFYNFSTILSFLMKIKQQNMGSLGDTFVIFDQKFKKSMGSLGDKSFFKGSVGEEGAEDGGINPSSPTVFALVLKIAQPRGKIAPGTFKFILSLHFSEKIPNLPPTPGVG